MPTLTTTVECPVHDSFRVQQVAGLFDLPLVGRACETFTAELPGLDEPWTIGAIVGPSVSDVCTPDIDVIVPLRGSATHWRRGSVKLKGVATTYDGLKDSDGLALTCDPPS